MVFCGIAKKKMRINFIFRDSLLFLPVQKTIRIFISLSFMNRYLEKHRLTDALFKRPDWVPDLVVCIPLLNEPNWLQTLHSLHGASANTTSKILVLLLFNHSEDADSSVIEANTRDFSHFAQAAANLTSPTFSIQAHLLALPKKHAGVGLARKILMDEGVRLFTLTGNERGILVAMDGDSTVASNYFQAIARFFEAHPKLEAASIYFEHPLPESKIPRLAIIQYELHLRYFVEAQKMTGLPTAFQTIGSSMAVRQTAYQKEGGMNRRKAGEDFYFLQKFARKGTLGNLLDTTVFPSPRISDRVPFGTGRAMDNLLKTNNLLLTHPIIIFDQIKEFFDGLPHLWNQTPTQAATFLKTLAPAVQDFLSSNNIHERIQDTQKHTASQAAFIKRFFNWFDGFVMMKYVHFARDVYYPDEPVLSVAYDFAVRETSYSGSPDRPEALLDAYRKMAQTG